MAAPSLSPKRAAEIMRQYRHAVMVLAMQRAKRAVQADIRAKGLKIAQFTARDITEQAEVYLAQHRDELITKAAADCLTFPEFARYRCAELKTSEKLGGPCSSNQISVQMLGAERRADQ